MPNHSLLEEIKSKKIKFNGVSSDSRSIKKGNIFFAIPGNEIDGSRFINQAIKKGAAAIVVPSYSKKRYPKNTTVIKVKDCLLYTSPSPRDEVPSRKPSSA
mgnify:CR=1 FL=1